MSFQQARLYVPEAIVVEILIRISAIDLVRYKTVCKQWKSLIEDPYVINLQKKRAKNIILARTDDSLNCIPWDGGDALFYSKTHKRILGSSTNGFICIRWRKNKYFLINPATGKSFRLPPLQSGLIAFHMKLYYVEQRKQYIVFAISKYRSRFCKNNLIPAVFSWATYIVGVDSRWEYIDFDVGDIQALTWGDFLLSESGPMSLVQYTDEAGKKTMKIQRFNLQMMKIENNEAPFYFNSDDKDSQQLHEWDGKTAFSKIDEMVIHTWVLEDLTTSKWKKETTVLAKNEVIDFSNPYYIYCVQEGKMWITSKSRLEDVFSLNLVTKSVEKISCDATIYEFVPYQPTLELIGR